MHITDNRVHYLNSSAVALYNLRKLNHSKRELKKINDLAKQGVKFREVKHNIFTLSYEGLTVTAQVTETGLKINP